MRRFCLLSIHVEQGRIFRDIHLPGVCAAERAALYVAAVEVLAKLHSLDLASLNLEGYGKGSGYCRRQVRSVVLNKSKPTHFELQHVCSILSVCLNILSCCYVVS